MVLIFFTSMSKFEAQKIYVTENRIGYKTAWTRDLSACRCAVLMVDEPASFILFYSVTELKDQNFQSIFCVSVGHT